MSNVVQLSLLADAAASLKPLPRTSKANAKGVSGNNALPKAKLCSPEQAVEFRSSAFHSAINRRSLSARMLKLLGSAPTVEQLDAVDRPLRIGYVAGALAKSVSGPISAKEEALLYVRAEVILYSMASFGATKMKADHVGMRDKRQDAAVTSAKNSIKGLLAMAGIANPRSAGKDDAAKGGNPGGAKTADTKAKAAVKSDVAGEALVVGKVKDFASFLSYLTTQANAMARSMNANASLKDDDHAGDGLIIRNLIGDFVVGVGQLNAKRV